ncbi:hypothetical protein EJB05_47969, partial [Eragrostis curvula]
MGAAWPSPPTPGNRTTAVMQPDIFASRMGGASEGEPATGRVRTAEQPNSRFNQSMTPCAPRSSGQNFHKFAAELVE